jgi:hypothetical protein
VFDGDEVGEPAFSAGADDVYGGADVVRVFAVEPGESFECGSKDLGWERDFGFWRREGVYASNSGFVKRDREALFDVAFPKKFENLVRVGRECESGCGSGTMLLHNSFVIEH